MYANKQQNDKAKQSKNLIYAKHFVRLNDYFPFSPCNHRFDNGLQAKGWYTAKLALSVASGEKSLVNN